MQQSPPPPRPQIVASDAPAGDAQAFVRALAVARQRAAAGVLHFPHTHDTEERAA